MNWINRFKALIRHFLAVQLRQKVRRHTATSLSQLDDRMLADIGIPRHRIAECAREVAHRAVPVPSMPNSGRKSVLAQLRSWRERRAVVRELLRLDDRILRDIGIKAGRVDDVTDPVVSRHRGIGMAHPMVQFSDAMEKILAPAANESRCHERHHRTSVGM